VTRKPARARVCALALIGLTGVAVTHAGAQSVSSPSCGTLLPPRVGAYFGAFPDFNRPPTVTEDDVQAAKIDAFALRAGHRLAWVYFTQSWYRGLAFPRDRVVTIWRSGAVPYIAFLPHSGVFYGAGRPQEYPEARFTLQRIIDGGFDLPLRAWARAAREHPSAPVVRRRGQRRLGPVEREVERRRRDHRLRRSDVSGRSRAFS
jgi:hypothetical protein